MRHFRQLLSDDRGFTLIEVLVATLIVGVLAAIAIPTLRVAQAEGRDTPAKELVHTAQVTTETVALDAGGNYAAVSVALLHRSEPTIATTKVNTAAYLSTAKGTVTTYTLTVTSVATGNRFTLVRSTKGVLARSCAIPKTTSAHGGCENVKGTTGSW